MTSTSLPAPAWLPTVALVTVATVWGVTFTVVDRTADALPTADLVLWRFGPASLLLALLGRRRAALPPLVRFRSLLLGVLLGVGFLLQAWGLTYTDALTSGFLTGLLVVVAPVAAWLLFRERTQASTWVGVVLATSGVVVLGLHATGLGRGELLTLASATVWGLHLVLMSRWSVAEHAVGMARNQTAVVAALAGLVLLLRPTLGPGSAPLVLPADAATWAGVGFLAVVATGLTMVLLAWSQSRVPAARAAVVLTLEPAVSGVTATLAGAALTGRVVLGAVLLVAAMAVVELGRRQPAAAPAPSERSVVLTGSPSR